LGRDHLAMPIWTILIMSSQINSDKNIFKKPEKWNDIYRNIVEVID
jgi:hypothetical protein